MKWDNGMGMSLTECVTDNAVRLKIETKARADAEAGIYAEPYSDVSGTYQRQMVLSAANIVYAQAHEKRRMRIERMKERAA